MNWKTLALCSTMAGIGLVGCGTTTNNTTDAGPIGGDTGPTTEDAGPGQAVTYVIGTIRTNGDIDGSGAQAYGFDLDNMVDGPADTCQAAADFTSPETGGGGVDNQLTNALGLLAGMDLDGTIQGQINAGKILILLEISGINSFANDSDITVHAVLAQVQPEGVACRAHTAEGDCTGDTTNQCEWTAAASGTGGSCATTVPPDVSTACAAHTVEADCRDDQANACNWSMNTCSGIAAGQTFASQTDLGTVQGSITGGRLSAVTPMLPLHLSVQGAEIDLILRNVHFGGAITATGITGGEFGAKVTVDDVITIGEQIMPGLVTRDLINSVVMPDLDPEAADPMTCDSISAGMGFTALTATLSAN